MTERDGVWYARLTLAAAGALAAVGIFAASGGDAQVLRRQGDTWTEVSGMTGEVAPVLLEPSDRSGTVYGRVMTGFHVRFSNNDQNRNPACSLRLGYRLVGLRNGAGPRDSFFGEETWLETPPEFNRGDCLRAANNRNYDNLARENVRVAVPRHYITGINVCTDQGGDSASRSVKGIRIFTAQYTNRGTLEPTGQPESFVHAGCAQWHDRQNCPDGSVATGVRVHHSNDRIRGFALRCTPLFTGN